MNRKMSKRIVGRKNQLGQGMTEYIIIVALVAIAAIGMYSYFGHTVQGQMAEITNGLAGSTTGVNSGAKVVSGEASSAATAAATNEGLDNYGGSVGDK